MPIYEFYCSDCHRVFSFLSRAVNTSTRPACPRCGRARIERRASAFAVSRGRGEAPGASGDAEGPDDGLDEGRLEQAMAGLAEHAEGLDEDDPRAMAELMRRFYDRSGMPIGEGMEEALRRMQAGEDPDEIEEQLGDVLESEDPLGGGAPAGKRGARRAGPPSIDTTLYEL